MGIGNQLKLDAIESFQKAHQDAYDHGAHSKAYTVHKLESQGLTADLGKKPSAKGTYVTIHNA